VLELVGCARGSLLRRDDCTKAVVFGGKDQPLPTGSAPGRDRLDPEAEAAEPSAAAMR